MKLKIYFFLLVIFILSTNNLDVNLNLWVELLSENHPLIINLKESLSENLNPIDLFAVFDLSGSMRGEINQIKESFEFNNWCFRLKW